MNPRQITTLAASAIMPSRIHIPASTLPAAMVVWLRNGQAEEKAYAFAYDAMGRLCSSSYFSGAGASASNSFTERDISYDRNGNIVEQNDYYPFGGSLNNGLSMEEIQEHRKEPL